FLAVTVSVCDVFDRGEPCCAEANRLVRMRAVDGSYCLLHFATHDHRQRGPRFVACCGDWPGLERKIIACAVPGVDSSCIRSSLDQQCGLRFRCVTLAGS